METPIQYRISGNGAVEHVGAPFAAGNDIAGAVVRITACRVVVKSPGGHQAPGAIRSQHSPRAVQWAAEVDIDRTAKADDAHADLSFVVNEHSSARAGVCRITFAAHAGPGEDSTRGKGRSAPWTRLRRTGYGFLETKDGVKGYFHRHSVLDGKFVSWGRNGVLFLGGDGGKRPKASHGGYPGKHALRQWDQVTPGKGRWGGNPRIVFRGPRRGHTGGRAILGRTENIQTSDAHRRNVPRC